MKFLLVRHAQSLGNLSWSQYQASGGTADPPLTELGHAQASALAGAFADGRLPRPDHLMTSLMQRAVQTVAPVAQILNMPVTGVVDLHEVGGVYVGDYWAQAGQPRPGLGRADLLTICPRLLLPDTATDEGWYFQPFEERQEGWTRAKSVAERLLDQYGGTDDVVAIVCHGLFMQLLLRAVIAWEPDMATQALDVWIEMNNTGTILVATPGGYGDRAWLHWVNRTDHLTVAQLTS